MADAQAVAAAKTKAANDAVDKAIARHKERKSLRREAAAAAEAETVATANLARAEQQEAVAAAEASAAEKKLAAARKSAIGFGVGMAAIAAAAIGLGLYEEQIKKITEEGNKAKEIFDEQHQILQDYSSYKDLYNT